MDLFREEVEFGGVKENAHGDEQFLYLSMNTLAETLYTQYGKSGQSLTEFIRDFVALMSILGNDFVPHGMGLKIKDEGVERLLRIYKDRVQHTLLDAHTYNPLALREIFAILAQEEPDAMLKGIKKKFTARIGATSSKDPEEQALARFNDQPVLWAAERDMIRYVHVPGYERPTMVLSNDWKQTYDKEALWGADPRIASKAYVESLAWTLAYYMGDSVDTEWYYPWPLPPRAESIVQCLETQAIIVPNKQRNPLRPLEQLAMVLPQSSFHLLPKEYGNLPLKYPHAWPVSWSSYSFGRRFLWECEPLIPLVQPEQIRQWIEIIYE
jgi:5'-3' exonuclease